MARTAESNLPRVLGVVPDNTPTVMDTPPTEPTRTGVDAPSCPVVGAMMPPGRLASSSGVVPPSVPSVRLEPLTAPTRSGTEPLRTPPVTPTTTPGTEAVSFGTAAAIVPVTGAND